MLNQTKKKLLLIAIIVGFIFVLVATFLFAEHLSRQNSPKEISNILSKITLINQNGKAFNKQSLNQKPSLLFFGFTHCPEICPTTLSELSNVVDNLKNKIKPTNIIFVTIDPQRDTARIFKGLYSIF